MRACILTLAVLCCFGASMAMAAPIITTAPLPGGTHDAVGFDCIVVNVGSKAKTVTIEIVNATTGAVIAGNGPSTIEPGRSAVAQSPTLVTQYCRTTGLPPKAARIFFYARDASVNVLASTTVP